MAGIWESTTDRIGRVGPSASSILIGVSFARELFNYAGAETVEYHEVGGETIFGSDVLEELFEHVPEVTGGKILEF